jgi:hypothetical protein
MTRGRLRIAFFQIVQGWLLRTGQIIHCAMQGRFLIPSGCRQTGSDPLGREVGLSDRWREICGQTKICGQTGLVLLRSRCNSKFQSRLTTKFQSRLTTKFRRLNSGVSGACVLTSSLLRYKRSSISEFLTSD